MRKKERNKSLCWLSISRERHSGVALIRIKRNSKTGRRGDQGTEGVKLIRKRERIKSLCWFQTHGKEMVVKLLVEVDGRGTERQVGEATMQRRVQTCEEKREN